MQEFKFAPESQVPVTLSPDPVQGMSMAGWNFSARPSVPYQRKFRVTLYGMRWYLNEYTGLYDRITDPEHNAHLLELFYQEHGTWQAFYWNHPHLGRLKVRFAAKVDVPEGIQNSGGLVDKFDITLIHDNPSF